MTAVWAGLASGHVCSRLGASSGPQRTCRTPPAWETGMTFIPASGPRGTHTALQHQSLGFKACSGTTPAELIKASHCCPQPRLCPPRSHFNSRQALSHVLSKHQYPEPPCIGRVSWYSGLLGTESLYLPSMPQDVCMMTTAWHTAVGTDDGQDDCLPGRKLSWPQRTRLRQQGIQGDQGTRTSLPLQPWHLQYTPRSTHWEGTLTTHSQIVQAVTGQQTTFPGMTPVLK